MANIKFFKKATRPTSAGVGSVWFDSTRKAIVLTGATTAEDVVYSGCITNAVVDGETLKLTKTDGSVITVDFAVFATDAALNSALAPINNSLGGKQDKTDNTLATTDKTVSGAINEINTKVGNLTGALTWKGKFDTLPAVTNYEAGNVVGVGNKEYVLTVTGSTKAWEELGDEGSYLLKSVAEETYLKKAAGEVKTVNLANNGVTKEKLSTDVQSSLDKADNSLQKGNVASPTSDTDAVNKSYVDGKIENLITNDDSLNLNVPILIYTSTDDDSIAANKASISFYLKFWEKYTSRITDTTFGDPNIHRPSNICFIPTILTVSKSNNNALGTGIIFGIYGVPDISYYHGIFRATSMSDSTHDGSYKIVSINANTGKLESTSQLISTNISYSKFNTTAKDIFGAINEVNTLAKSKGNGTITEVRMNGASKGTSGVVDLGTVITAHQDISGKVDKTAIFPVLQQIDLSGTDADRKAKLDQFAVDWKALTGASNLAGARFVGKVPTDVGGGDTLVLLNYDVDGNYSGISMTDLNETVIKKVTVNTGNGSVDSVPLFSHLEPIEILTDNTIESKQKNIDNLNAYKGNLDCVGVFTSNGFQVPIIIFNAYVGSLHYSAYDNIYVGIYFSTDDNGVYFFQITSDGEFRETAFVLQGDSITVDTTMSDTSTNPVQNKVIKAYIDGLVGNVMVWTEYE